MDDLDDAYKALEILNAQPECSTCRRCEENVGQVYLLGDEASHVKKALLPVVRTAGGVEYVGKRHGGWCSCYQDATNRCLIYQNRPLCCRIYPLDLMAIEGEVWWVLHEDCPIAVRFLRERRQGALMAVTKRLESALSAETIQQWLRQDRFSQQLEQFVGVEEPVIKLRRLGERSTFLG